MGTRRWKSRGRTMVRKIEGKGEYVVTRTIAGEYRAYWNGIATGFAGGSPGHVMQEVDASLRGAAAREHKVTPSGERFDVGTRVMFSREYLKSTAQHTGTIPFLRGEIVKHVAKGPELHLVSVRWDSGMPSTVNVKNLVREDQLHLEGI